MLKQVRHRQTDALSRVGWEQFETLVADHYRRQGYDVQHVGTAGTGRRFDGGIDLKMRRGTEFVIVQCKHWNAKQVPHNPVHQLLGLLTTTRGATGAILVTSGEFTPHALRSAAQNPAIQLIDGNAIRQLLGPLPPALLAEVNRDPDAPTPVRPPPLPPLPGAPAAVAPRAGAGAGRKPSLTRHAAGPRRGRGPVPAVAAVFVVGVLGWALTQWLPRGGQTRPSASRVVAVPAAEDRAAVRPRTGATVVRSPEGRLARGQPYVMSAAQEQVPSDLVHLTPTNVWSQAELDEWKRRNAESMEIIRRTTPELPVAEAR
jgi:hypothetical protein